MTPKLKIKAHFRGQEYECDDLIDAGEWWCEQYFVASIASGFFSNPKFVVIEARTAQDALDALIDNGKWNHLFVVDNDEPEEDWHSRGGNFGIRYDTELIIIIECEVTEAWSELHDSKS